MGDRGGDGNGSGDIRYCFVDSYLYYGDRMVSEARRREAKRRREGRRVMGGTGGVTVNRCNLFIVRCLCLICRGRAGLRGRRVGGGVVIGDAVVGSWVLDRGAGVL